MLSKMKAPCQIQKDERFWVAACMMHFFFLKGDERTERFTQLLQRRFGKQPPWHQTDSAAPHGSNVSVVTFTSTLRSTSLLRQVIGLTGSPNM